MLSNAPPYQHLKLLPPSLVARFLMFCSFVHPFSFIFSYPSILFLSLHLCLSSIIHIILIITGVTGIPLVEC